MKYIYALLLAVFGWSVGWGVRDILAEDTMIQTRQAHNRAMEERWHNAFQAGWQSARTHYSRYYTEEQRERVFGLPYENN